MSQVAEQDSQRLDIDHSPGHSTGCSSMASTKPLNQPADARPRCRHPGRRRLSSVTEEGLRDRLEELGTPTEKFQPQEGSTGAPRHYGMVAPKPKDFTSTEEFQRAQRRHKRYHNAWRNFFQAKARLEKGPDHYRPWLRKIVLRAAKVLKSAKEDYLRQNGAGVPVERGVSDDQRRERIDLLREQLAYTRIRIGHTHRLLSEGAVSEQWAADSLKYLNNWKSKRELEIEDIEHELQLEGIIPKDNQLRLGRADTNSPLPDGREIASDSCTNIDTRDVTSAYRLDEVPNVPPLHETFNTTQEIKPSDNDRLASRKVATAMFILTGDDSTVKHRATSFLTEIKNGNGYSYGRKYRVNRYLTTLEAL